MHTVIAGGTSHIARAIVPYFLAAGDRVTLFARRPEALADVDAAVESDFSKLTSTPCDILINCIGAGTPDIVRGNPVNWFSVLEKFDDLAIQSLLKCNPGALYVHFSSGAVYDRSGDGFSGDGSCRTIFPNRISTADYYSVAKLYAEAKHRAYRQLRILDLRIFSFFSRHIKIDSGYFMTDVVQALLRGKTLLTSPVEMIRDYPHPQDLAAVIRRCAGIPAINTAADIASAAPVKKSEILAAFQEKFGLQYSFAGNIGNSPNGDVSVYAPAGSAAHRLCGLKPAWNSLNTLLTECAVILESHAGKTV